MTTKELAFLEFQKETQKSVKRYQAAEKARLIIDLKFWAIVLPIVAIIFALAGAIVPSSSARPVYLSPYLMMRASK